VELSPENKTESINAQESEGAEALAADKDSKFPLHLKFVWFDKC